MRPSQGCQGPQGPWGAQTSLATFVARHVKAGAWDGKTLGPGPQRKSPAGATVAIKPLVKVYIYIHLYVHIICKLFAVSKFDLWLYRWNDGMGFQTNLQKTMRFESIWRPYNHQTAQITVRHKLQEIAVCHCPCEKCRTHSGKWQQTYSTRLKKETDKKHDPTYPWLLFDVLQKELSLTRLISFKKSFPNIVIIITCLSSLTGWWFEPLWKIWVRHLGLLFFPTFHGKS